MLTFSLTATSIQRRSTSIKTLIHEFRYPRLGPGQMWEECAERVVYLERTVKAWGLWGELSSEAELTAIQSIGDHKALQMDGD